MDFKLAAKTYGYSDEEINDFEKLVSSLPQKPSNPTNATPDMVTNNSISDSTQSLNSNNATPSSALSKMFFGQEFPVTQMPGPASEATRQFYVYHKGTDLGTPIGTPIKAPWNGKVIFKGAAGPYGNRIGIQSPTGEIFYLSHLREVPEVGETFMTGQTLGFTGNTGQVIGSGHVDIESGY